MSEEGYASKENLCQWYAHEEQRKHIGGIYEGVVERQRIMRSNTRIVIREVYLGDEGYATALYLSGRFRLKKITNNTWEELPGTEDLPLESQYDS